jgi:hypothetical protein
MSLWGYSTNGQVLELFRNAEIASLWERYKAVDALPESKEAFWTRLGTRLGFTRQHIAELESQAAKTRTGEGTSD